MICNFSTPKKRTIFEKRNSTHFLFFSGWKSLALFDRNTDSPSHFTTRDGLQVLGIEDLAWILRICFCIFSEVIGPKTSGFTTYSRVLVGLRSSWRVVGTFLLIWLYRVKANWWCRVMNKHPNNFMNTELTSIRRWTYQTSDIQDIDKDISGVAKDQLREQGLFAFAHCCNDWIYSAFDHLADRICS